jgi:hypothetical protein
MPKQKYKVSGAELAREIGQSEGTVSRKRGQGLTDDQIRQEARQRLADDANNDGERDSKRAAEIRYKKAQAAMLELQLEQERGELVRYADVEAWESTNIIRARDIILRIAPEMADRLAAESDPILVREMLEAEHNRALAELKRFPRT